MKMWQFEDNQGFKWLITEDNGSLKLEVMTFSMRAEDWSLIDEMKSEGKLKFIKEFDVIEK